MHPAPKASGFTLIELMIVVTLIGILAAVAIPAYQDYTVRTRINEATGIFLPIKTASALFYSDNGFTPGHLQQLERYGILASPTSHSGEYVQSLQVFQDGGLVPKPGENGDKQVGVQMKLRSPGDQGGDQLREAAGATLYILGSVAGATIKWGIHGDPDRTDLADKYWPDIL